MSSAEYRAAHKAEMAAYQKQWYLDHRDEVLAKVTQWCAENPDKRIATQRRYRSTHKAQDSAYRKRYYAEHKAEVDAQADQYHNAHKDEAAASAKKWWAEHPDLGKIYHARRRARICAAPINDLTVAQWRQLKDIYGHRCAYCGKVHERLAAEHMTPLVRGGAHTMSNIVPACKSCNSRKGTRTYTEFVLTLWDGWD